MEAIARRYLQEIQITNGYIRGYTDDEDDVQALLQDVDTNSGGFVINYNHGKENAGVVDGKYVTYFVFKGVPIPADLCSLVRGRMGRSKS